MPSALSKTCTCYSRAAIDRNLPGLDLFSFGDVELQDTLLEDGLDLLCFYNSGQGEGAAHLAGVVLTPHIGALLHLRFLLLGGNDGQGITYSSDLHLLWLEAWQRCLDHIPLLILGLIDVDREGARRQELEARPDKALLKQAVHGLA